MQSGASATDGHGVFGADKTGKLSFEFFNFRPGTNPAGAKNGSYGFHTNNEANPWWQVDLGRAFALGEVRIFNRLDCCGERSRTLRVLLSQDGTNWHQVYAHQGAPFGGTNGTPLSVGLGGRRARYVRLQLAETNWFHLDEVEVFGVNRTPD